MKHDPGHLFAHCESLPAQERIVDALADVMLDADALLEMLRAEDAAHLRWMETRVQHIYEITNGLMKAVSD